MNGFPVSHTQLVLAAVRILDVFRGFMINTVIWPCSPIKFIRELLFSRVRLYFSEFAKFGLIALPRVPTSVRLYWIGELRLVWLVLALLNFRKRNKMKQND